MIDQATVDRIIDAANILDVVSDFVTLRKRGVNYVGLCPFHDDKTPSFSVSPSKEICKCFSCGKGGGSVHFIMEHEQLSYYEALKYLARKYNIEVKERELSDEERQQQTDRESMLIVNTFAQEYFTNTLFNHVEGRAIGLSYFRERGFTDETIRKFALGYSLDQRDALFKEAEKSGYQTDYLLKTGLCLEGQNGYKSDRFRGRVIFPVFSLSGKVLAFGGRILKKDEKMAKYVNSPESDIYHKSRELYGLFQAKQAIVKNDTCFLVEGYTDVLSMHQSGIENVVASSGTALTPGQIRLIHRFTNNITVIYDGDAAGIKASLRGIDLLLQEGMNIKVVLLPEGEDPDSFSKQQSAASFISYIKSHETDFIRFKTNLLLESAGDDPIKRAELINDIVQSIAIIPDSIIRSVYVKECSHLMDISEKVLLQEIIKLEKKKLEGGSGVTNKMSGSTPTTPTPTTEVASTTETAASKDTTAPKYKSLPTDIFELALLKYIIRYSKEPLFTIQDEENGEEKVFDVLEYIVTDLRNDQIEFLHPIYREILSEAIEKKYTDSSALERYFVSHHNELISQLAVDLVSEKYNLSKIHTKFQKVVTEKERLQELVPRALFELKDAMISQFIKEVKAKLKVATQSGDRELSATLMKELSEMYELKASLSKCLGERIVSPKN